MEVSEVALYLKCDDVLIIPDLSMVYAKEKLRDEKGVLARGCEESVKFLLQDRFFILSNLPFWSLKRGEKEYNNDESTIGNRRLFYKDFWNNPDYNRLVISRTGLLTKKMKKRFMLELNNLIGLLILLVFQEKEEAIQCGVDIRIIQGIVYDNGRKVTSSFEETIEMVPSLNYPSTIKTDGKDRYPEDVLRRLPRRLENPEYKERFNERLGKIPEFLAFVIRFKISEETREVIPRGVKEPRTVREEYAKECTEKSKPEDCMCIPTRTHIKECSFANLPLVTDFGEKTELFKNSNIGKSPEAVAYLSEYPVFVLKKGTVLCHSTIANDILEFDRNKGIFVSKKGSVGWWNKYFVGQSKYGGGWFTYETNYGGPGFGILLSYLVVEDIPILFVPNHKIRKDDPEYFPDNTWNIEAAYFSGSHVVKGPKNWKEKGFAPIEETYFADVFAKRLLDLGFPGYISCDECEVFLSYDAMRTGLSKRPFKISFESKKEYDHNFRTIFDSMIDLLCDPVDEECPLQIKEGSRVDGVEIITISKEKIEETQPFSEFLDRYNRESRLI